MPGLRANNAINLDFCTLLPALHCNERQKVKVRYFLAQREMWLPCAVLVAADGRGPANWFSL
jgi:hypothetical protein